MSAVNDVLAWWMEQMRTLLPPRLRAGGEQGTAVIADLHPGAALAFVHRSGGRETPLGGLDSPRLRTLLARRPRLLLRVPATAGLERTLDLPLATEPELPRVLGYEFDRLTPFAADEAAWTYAIDRRDRATGRLHLRIALLPHAVLAPALEALRARSLAPAAVLLPRASGGTWRLDLAPPGPRRTPALAAAALACAALALTAAALPFVLQQAELGRIESRIARLRPEVAEADALRRRIADRSSGLDAVTAESARVGQALIVLGTLTTLLPDDTWLTALSLKQRALTISGRSASAARLIPLLAADPAIRNATLTAPVTRAEGGGDVFSIRAEFGS